MSHTTFVYVIEGYNFFIMTASGKRDASFNTVSFPSVYFITASPNDDLNGRNTREYL
jgi:hypothetical protein